MNTDNKQAINEVLNRAAYGLDVRDLSILSQCFAENAQMSLRIAGGDLIGPFEGRDAIMKLMTDSMDVQTDQRRHQVSNVFFEGAGEGAGEGAADRATAVSNLSLMSIENGAIALISTGVYRDEVVLNEGQWQLLNRYLELDLPY